MDLQNIRNDFIKNDDKIIIDKNPIFQFKKWLHEALGAGIKEATAFSLSTSTSDGIPSSRILLLKEIFDDTFVFFTNYESQKGKELEQNPNAAMLFFWADMERQVRISGKVEKISSSRSDEYFNIRPYESQINAIISEQSKVIENRELLEIKRDELLNKKKELNRPDFWGGYYLTPTLIEFWQGGKNRLHHRFLFKKESQIEEWKISLLSP